MLLRHRDVQVALPARPDQDRSVRNALRYQRLDELPVALPPRHRHQHPHHQGRRWWPLLLREPAHDLVERARADGQVLLVERAERLLADLLPLRTVDGRSESSGGIGLYDLAAYLIELGAVDAMNLDGGGSTTMFLDGKVINKPSDKEGERKVGDALLVFPRTKRN